MQACCRYTTENKQHLKMNKIHDMQKLKSSHCGTINMYESVNWSSIGSDNGLLPIQHQAII